MYYLERKTVDIQSNFYSFMASATVREEVNLMGSNEMHVGEIG